MNPSHESQPRVLAAFEGEIEPVRVPGLYRLGMAVVALAMVLLPLIYLAIIAGTAWAVWYHTVTHYSVFDEMNSTQGAFLIYVTPIVVGVILVIFMIKPLFAPRASEASPVSLEREREPLFFAYIEKLCGIVGAPRPHRIDVSCDVNAAASFRRGIRSLFGADLVLMVGLPLVAGLNLRQLTGVLAHEFGHFAQGSGMRLTYIIRSVNAWFARVVYQRDAWDEKLAQWSGRIDLRIGIILYTARLFVWLTRGILWGLMWFGHGISCFMSRQMEFDADRYEARVAGSEVFQQTAERLPVLMMAHSGALSDLSSLWVEKRLGDNLPTLVMANVDQIPAGVLQALRKRSEEETTGAFDTHPCDRERIASAKRESAAGIFRMEAPASVLLTDFDGLAREASLEFYCNSLGETVSEESLISTVAVVAAQKAAEEENKALARYFQGTYDGRRPLGLLETTLEASADPAADGQALTEARSRFDALMAAARDQIKAKDDSEERQAAAICARALVRANLKFKPAEFGLARTGLEGAEEVIQREGACQQRVAGELEPFEDALRERLAAGIRLARADGDSDARIGRELEGYRAIEGVRGDLETLRERFIEFTGLLGKLEGNEQHKLLNNAIRTHTRTLAQLIVVISRQLGKAPYPLEHARSEIDLGQALIEKIPPRDDVGEVYQACESLFENVFRLYARLIARLALAAEEVESGLGLPRQEIPENVEPDAAEPAEA